MAQHMNYIISSLNGHINNTPLVGFTDLNSEPGAVYSLLDTNTNKALEGLKFHQEQSVLIVEHNGKIILALKGFFSHKENPAKFVVDKAADGTIESIITTDATVMDEDGRAYIIASEPLLVANSEQNTTNPVTPEDTTAEAEPDFLTDNWVWFAVGGAIILAGVTAGGSSSSSSKGPSTDVPDISRPTLESIKATGNTITLTYNEALDGNNLPEASTFAIQVIGGGVNNPVTAVAISDSGDTIILTLTNPIAKGSNFTIAYTDPTTGDDANAIQDEQGNDASTFNGKTGLVVDGYIQGAQLYADYDNNGIAEDDEILEGVITDEFGRFFLTTDINAPLIAVGGTNIDTGIKNTLIMRAPEGATVINPITTVVQQYLSDNQGTSLEQAETAVKEILGITLPANESLSDYEPISSKNQEMQEIAAQIVEVAMQAETTKAGDGSTVFENIAAAKAPLDLTTTDDVTAITKGTGITAETVQALVTQTTNIKDTDTIADITTQQKSLIVALKDDTGLEDDDLNSSVGTIEVTRKFTGNIQYSIDDGVIWTDDFDAEEGENNLQVRQIDAEGKVLSAITTFDFIFNTKAPTVVILDNTEGVATGDVTYGFIFSEAVTSFTVADIIISGGEKGLLTKIDDMTYHLVVTPDFGSIIPIKVDVKADVVTDIAGNANAAAQSVQLVDTPKVGVFQVKIGADTGVYDFDFTTNQASQTISAKLSQSLVTGEQLYGSVDGGVTWTDITGKVTGIAISWDTSLIEGENSIAFKIGEDGVNTGSQSYILDTKVPTQMVDSVAISNDTGSSASDFITKTASQTISAQLSVVLVAGEMLSGSVDGGATWLDITDKVTGRVISWTDADLIEGKHSIVFKISNQYGNTGANTGSKDYVLDTMPPIYAIVDVAISDDTGNSTSDFITKTTSQTISAELSKSLETGNILYGSVNGGRTWTDITNKVAGRVINWDTNLISGENSIVFKVRDLAGNETSNIGSTNYVLDTKAPTQTIDNVMLSADTGSSTSDFITNQASQTITAQLSAELAANDRLYGTIYVHTRNIWIDITDKVTGTDISWDGIDISWGILISGSSDITFKVVDLAGNEAISNSTLYTIDTKAPTVTITDDTDGTATGAVTYTFVFSEKVHGFTADSIEVTGGAKGTLKTLDDNTYTLTVTPPYNSNAPITLVVKAGSVTDTAGNKLAHTETDVQTILTTTDTSIVIFDTTTGKSSTHSDRKFTDAVTDIYIIVHPEEWWVKFMEFEEMQVWESSENLTESIKVHLISSDSNKLFPSTERGSLVRQSLKIVGTKEGLNTGGIVYFGSVLRGGAVLGCRSTGRASRGVISDDYVVRIWRGEISLTVGTVGGTIGAGVLTSQGLT